jgi:bacteriorhodopsin
VPVSKLFGPSLAGLVICGIAAVLLATITVLIAVDRSAPLGRWQWWLVGTVASAVLAIVCGLQARRVARL